MLVIAAECAEGLGSPEFTRDGHPVSECGGLSGRGDGGQPVRIDQWQLEECAKVVRDIDVVVVAGGIPEGERRRFFLRSADTVEDAVQEGLRPLRGRGDHCRHPQRTLYACVC